MKEFWLWLFLCYATCLVELWKGENFQKVKSLSETLSYWTRERVNMILALVLPTKRRNFLSHSEPTLQWPQHSGVNMNKSSVLRRVIYLAHIRDFLCCSRGDLLSYVWGDRCGREVPHFDSRPVGWRGNGPKTLACGPAAELTFFLVVVTKTISLCPSNDLEMLIHEKLDEKCERTQVLHEGDPWKYIGFLLVQRNS